MVGGFKMRDTLLRVFCKAKDALRVMRLFIGKSGQHDRLYFPLDFSNMPPRMGPSEINALPARSPIDGMPAERFLFSTPDTRFGDKRINHIYLDSRHGIAITHPPIEVAELYALYRRYYSHPPTHIKPPQGASPYRKFGQIKSWEKVFLRFPLERLLNEPEPFNASFYELSAVLRSSGVGINAAHRFLDVGCFEGAFMDLLRKRVPWVLSGIETNELSVSIARSKGHQVWHGSAESAADILPKQAKFDVVYLGQSIEHVDDPVNVLVTLGRLLAPGGVIVISTPNLDSHEIDWFGPTWAHWHAPYHRHIFSLRGLRALARRAGFSPIHLRTFSDPYWTAMSLAQNEVGLAGSVSHAINFDHQLMLQAGRINAWKRLLWNHLGKGDYSYISMRAAK